jgi:hypothetical protein
MTSAETRGTGVYVGWTDLCALDIFNDPPAERGSQHTRLGAMARDHGVRRIGAHILPLRPRVRVA